MKSPFVSRATYMLMVQAANTASLEREHERRRAERAEARCDALFASYQTLKRDGYQEVTPLDPNERYVILSIEDADAEAAKHEAETVERAD